MDEKTLLALFDKFEKSTAVEMKFFGNGSSLELRRKEAFAVSAPAFSAPHSSSPAHNASGASASGSYSIDILPDASSSDAVAASGNECIKSPIVGTFYRSASPDTPPFAEVGKKIMKGQKLCIIEAMKMMNALEAEFDCEIVKLLANNGDMVEFDQNLFEVRAL